MLASSDYEGTVTLWDAFAGAKTRVFQVRFYFLARDVIYTSRAYAMMSVSICL